MQSFYYLVSHFHITTLTLFSSARISSGSFLFYNSKLPVSVSGSTCHNWIKLFLSPLSHSTRRDRKFLTPHPINSRSRFFSLITPTSILTCNVKKVRNLFDLEECGRLRDSPHHRDRGCSRRRYLHRVWFINVVLIFFMILGSIRFIIFNSLVFWVRYYSVSVFVFIFFISVLMF